MTTVDELQDAAADIRTRRNWLKGWSTTDARNPVLREMAKRAGLSTTALKRLMGRVAASEERLAADVEARTAEFQKQESAFIAKRRQLDSDRAAIAAADTPERRAEEALDDKMQGKGRRR